MPVHYPTMSDSDTTEPSLEASGQKPPSLEAFGERLRTLRARRGLTRKALAEASAVSDRYLSNLESGIGNPTLLILEQLASGLDCSLAELIGDVTTRSPEWLLMRELLEGRGEQDMRKARLAVGEALGMAGAGGPHGCRIALIGLRGAGKTTLAHMLSEDLDVPFLELSTEIERVAGYSVREIQDLYGPNAYRRYERRTLEEILQIYPDFVLATPGGLVSEPATFNLLLRHCTTVWLRADPEDHMGRVARQGDMRPMAASTEAMEDLRRILSGRAAFYSKADLSVDTSRQPLADTFQLLRAAVRDHLGLTA
jgi:XRE family aerobic/anaerobic benzoate catabolism transcriptional regulator